MRGQERSRRHFIDGVIAVGRFYQHNPEAYFDGMKTKLSMYVGGRDAKRALAATAKAFGKCEKFSDEKHIAISRQFGEMVRVELFAPRSDVCQRLVLGTRVEPGMVIPAAREIRIPEAAVDVVGWRCDPLLLGLADCRKGFNSMAGRSVF